MTRVTCSGRYDTFMQHDVQELNRVLVDKLEEKMKARQPAPRLFEAIFTQVWHRLAGH